MSARWLYALVAAAALAAGFGAWWATRGDDPRRTDPPSISGAALYAASFRDPAGASRSLGQFQGQWIVLNFWATWCAPCREEMPGFERLQRRWKDRGVVFLGVSNEDPATVRRFADDMGVSYALWTGGEEVMDLSRRLGNRHGVLPHTALINPAGRVVETRVGTYKEAELDERLTRYSAKSD